MTKRRIYIAGPIAKGDLKHNIQQATDAFIALAKSGFAPFCPHWSCFSGPIVNLGGAPIAYAMVTPNDLTHADWLGIDLSWVSVSDCVLRLPGESVGADMEVRFARQNNIPVFFAVDECVNWLKSQEKAAA